jgi:two-component system, LytTR family, response regulator
MLDLITAILVDDELSNLNNLRHKLEEFCKTVRVIAVSQKPEEAIYMIRDLRPDLLFLDIEMPQMSGFGMLEELGEYNAEIIFTTAYNQYAIDAIRISAFDYLVKPVSIGDLQNAVNRLATIRSSHTKERLDILKESVADVRSADNKIAVPTADGLEFIKIMDVLRIESSSYYSKIFFLNGKTLLVTRLLKDFEEILLPYRFFRVHNSHLVNLRYIQKFSRADGGQVIMENGDIINISRRRREEFLNLFHR